MIGNWENSSKSESSRFFEYAIAYLNASIDICTKMTVSKKEANWANGNVSLMLAAHSTELFLKGKLLTKNKVETNSHNIEKLYQLYLSFFPEEEDNFDCLFITKYIGFTEKEIKDLKKIRKAQPSVIYRYPVNSHDVEWNGLHGVEPEDFLCDLKLQGKSYQKLIKQ